MQPRKSNKKSSDKIDQLKKIGNVHLEPLVANCRARHNFETCCGFVLQNELQDKNLLLVSKKSKKLTGRFL